MSFSYFIKGMKTYFNLQVGLCQIQQERWAEHWMVADFSVDSVTSNNCYYRESTKRAHRKKKKHNKADRARFLKSILFFFCFTPTVLHR